MPPAPAGEPNPQDELMKATILNNLVSAPIAPS